MGKLSKLNVAVTVMWLLVSPGSPSPIKLDYKCVSPVCQQQAAKVVQSLNTTVDPCEDFYKFACGSFELFNPIPEGKQWSDSHTILQERMDNIANDILRSPVNLMEDPEALVKAKHMYASCMDTERLEREGLKPLLKILDTFGGWPATDPSWKGETSWNTLAKVTAEYGLPLMFNIVVRNSFDKTNETIIYLNQPVLGVPVPLVAEDNMGLDFSDLYEPRAEDSPFIKYIAKMAVRLASELGTGVTELAILEDVRRIIDFMREITTAVKNESQNMDLEDLDAVEPNSVILTIEQLQEWTENSAPDILPIDWLEFFRTAFLKSGVNLSSQHEVFISDLKKLKSILELVTKTEPRIIANFVMSRVMVLMGPETNKFMYDAATMFYQQQNFIPSDYPRWKYCVHKVNDYPNVGLSMAVSHQFIKQYFNMETLSQANRMVGDLRDSFEELLLGGDWMDNETTAKALEKAKAMVVLLGFPPWVEDTAILNNYYSKLIINLEGHFGNMQGMRAYVQGANMETLAYERDRNEWTKSPLIVNAFYNKLNNRITFPIGMMEKPFFSGNKISILDYSRIGSVIGHEITHGFDSSGRSFDKDGKNCNWWSKESEETFKEKAQCFIDQYNGYTIPEINGTVNGVKTLTENIADNGALRETYGAWKRLLPRLDGAILAVRLPGLENFSFDQMFFLGYATMWCRAETPEGLKYMTTDEHSPNRYRVNGPVSNMNEFSKAWNCPVNSPMNPQKKCVLW